jgi:RHS repeat-associated protein
MDDKERIAIVESRTFDLGGNDPAPEQIIRYQLGNHIGSVTLEFDHQAKIISYEEYYPYGSTSYQAARNQTETAKRYRYTSKERDEESGLYLFGARYNAPQLCRWISADPLGLTDGTNLYRYVGSHPIGFADHKGTGGQPFDASVDASKPLDTDNAAKLPFFLAFEALWYVSDQKIDPINKFLQDIAIPALTPTPQQKVLLSKIEEPGKKFRATHQDLGETELNSIDIALMRVAHDNPDLIAAFYNHYANHDIGTDPDEGDLGTTSSGNTEFDPRCAIL